MSQLKLKRLNRSFGSRVAVRDLSLDVPKGEIFGLLGPNGAGKTTTIKMICGLLSPSEGSIEIDGEELAQRRAARKADVGYVPQELAVYEELSAKENLRFFASPYRMPRALRDERVAWALSLAGLADRCDEPVTSFSGGMKRRLNLVVALLHKPQLLVLDEPTVGVDPQSKGFLFEAIKELRDTHGMTVVYASHHLAEVQSLCDRVAILDHGTLVAAERVDVLLKRGEALVLIEVVAQEEDLRSALHDLAFEIVEAGQVRVSLQESARALTALHQSGISVLALRSAEETLESAFLRLTGHSLRDGDS